MLTITKNITINGESKIGGVQVVFMSATIGTDGNTNANTNKTIMNQELYNSNKVEVRKDMADFDTAVFQVQDSLLVGGEE